MSGSPGSKCPKAGRRKAHCERYRAQGRHETNKTRRILRNNVPHRKPDGTRYSQEERVRMAREFYRAWRDHKTAKLPWRPRRGPGETA